MRKTTPDGNIIYDPIVDVLDIHGGTVQHCTPHIVDPNTNKKPIFVVFDVGLSQP
jgi:hypothetical protein